MAAALAHARLLLDLLSMRIFVGMFGRNGDGGYVKAEYSQAYAQHWRATVSGSLIGGEPGDFIGQYRLNSHLTLGLRYSF